MTARRVNPICFVGFSTFFWITTAQGAPPILPDLQIDHIRLGSDGTVFVQVSNVGTKQVPYTPVTYLSVFVDHWKAASFQLYLPGDPWRFVGGSSEFNTGVRLHGPNRRLIAIVDPDNLNVELDDYQNTMSMEISAPVRQGFDLYLQAAVDSNRVIYYEIKNVGTQASPANLPVKTTLKVNGTTVGSENTPMTVPALSVGQQAIVYPPGGHTLPTNTPTPVRASISFLSFPDLDTANNVFDDYVWYLTPADIPTLYGPLLTAFNNGLKWYPPCQSQSGCMGTNCPPPLTYNQWNSSDPSMTTRLNEFLLLLEQARPLPLNDRPPVFYCSGSVSANDGRDAYLGYVAHSLWLERNAARFGMTWRLTDLALPELELVLSSDGILGASSPKLNGTKGYHFDVLAPGNARVLFQFLRHLGALKPSENDTAWAFLEWYRAYVRHGWSNGQSPFDNFGYDGAIPVDKVPYPFAAPPGVPFYWAPSGCWSASRTLQLVLRTVNIPVRRYDSYIALLATGGCGDKHSSVELPTITYPGSASTGVVLTHSDNLYEGTYWPIGDSAKKLPVYRLFFSRTDAEQWLDFPRAGELNCDYDCTGPASGFSACDSCGCSDEGCNSWLSSGL